MELSKEQQTILFFFQMTLIMMFQRRPASFLEVNLLEEVVSDVPHLVWISNHFLFWKTTLKKVQSYVHNGCIQYLPDYKKKSIWFYLSSWLLNFAHPKSRRESKLGKCKVVDLLLSSISSQKHWQKWTCLIAMGIWLTCEKEKIKCLAWKQ